MDTGFYKHKYFLACFLIFFTMVLFLHPPVVDSDKALTFNLKSYRLTFMIKVKTKCLQAKISVYRGLLLKTFTYIFMLKSAITEN